MLGNSIRVKIATKESRYNSRNNIFIFCLITVELFMMWLGFLATIRRLIKAIIFAQYIEDTGRERDRGRE